MTNKSLIKLLIAIACSFILFAIISAQMSGFDIYLKNNFDDDITIEVVHPSGSIEYYDSVNFPLVNRGDVIYGKVNLPKERYIQNSAINFFVYHSVVTIYDHNENVLYEYGEELAEKGAMIGGVYVSANIPEESWGKYITIKLEIQEDGAFSKLHDFMVMRSIDSYKYLIITQEGEILIFLAILVSAIIIIFVLIFYGEWNAIRMQGIYLLSFLALVSIWFLEYNGMINLFTNYNRFTANIEYISLLSTPIMLTLFFYEQVKMKKVKQIQLALALIFGIFAFVCTLLNYNTVNYHYCRILSTFHVLLLCGISIDLIIILKYEIKDNLSGEVIKYGGLISLVIIFLEIIRYNLHRHINYYIAALTRSYTSIAVIIFIVALVISYVVQLADHYVDEYEKRNLEKLAYYDVLTGISNRAGCYKYFKSLDISKKNSLVFLDADKLKYANDVFGHEMGDRLIKFIAEALKSAFERDGFYGRFGGDEFIAVIPGDKNEKIYNKMNTFNEILNQANKKKLFPFEISVSYGISISNRYNPISIDQLVKDADSKMYENKKMKKMNRA